MVYGDQSRRYDFGPAHPLTPRRFGPGIDLLRELGADRFEEPERADDETLARVHRREYIEAVRRCSDSADDDPGAGLVSWGDNPPFLGMHAAAAIVAGGSLLAMERILAGSTLHAFHPGGGLHHAMPGNASGFCVYNDVALAIARARDAGLRVLYVDVDVHHGDGVQTIFWRDPGVFTISIHETGAALFPGSGFLDETGGGAASGTKVNVPLEPGTGDASWLKALETVVPPLAESFQPDVLVSQHGCDTHVLDPLAHVHLTTAAMARAAALLHELAHRLAGGRWLATGGGGYDAYRVVPRAWALVWLAQAHRDVPPATPARWRARWADEAERYEQAPLPAAFIDPPAFTAPEPDVVVERNWRTTQRALDQALARLAM